MVRYFYEGKINLFQSVDRIIRTVPHTWSVCVCLCVCVCVCGRDGESRVINDSHPRLTVMDWLLSGWPSVSSWENITASYFDGIERVFIK